MTLALWCLVSYFTAAWQAKDPGMSAAKLTLACRKEFAALDESDRAVYGDMVSLLVEVQKHFHVQSVRYRPKKLTNRLVPPLTRMMISWTARQKTQRMTTMTTMILRKNRSLSRSVLRRLAQYVEEILPCLVSVS